ncbi:MAG: 3-isopropylmalate dehydrogenase, partial [Actinobacteria bacterium]
MTYKLGVIAGDGIGPEVVGEALKVIDAAGIETERTYFALGAERYLDSGEVLPEDTLEELRRLDAVLLGAVGDPRVPPGVLERGLLLKLRFELDLFVNLRPVKL